MNSSPQCTDTTTTSVDRRNSVTSRTMSSGCPFRVKGHVIEVLARAQRIAEKADGNSVLLNDQRLRSLCGGVCRNAAALDAGSLEHGHGVGERVVAVLQRVIVRDVHDLEAGLGQVPRAGAARRAFVRSGSLLPFRLSGRVGALEISEQQVGPLQHGQRSGEMETAVLRA